MKILLLSITVISSLLMVGIILLQQGKGAGLGSAFGGGARGGLYESNGQANPLSRVTAILATIFLASSLALSLHIGGDNSVIDELRETSTESVIPSDESGLDSAYDSINNADSDSGSISNFDSNYDSDSGSINDSSSATDSDSIRGTNSDSVTATDSNNDSDSNNINTQEAAPDKAAEIPE